MSDSVRVQMRINYRGHGIAILGFPPFDCKPAHNIPGEEMFYFVADESGINCARFVIGEVPAVFHSVHDVVRIIEVIEEAIQ